MCSRCQKYALSKTSKETALRALMKGEIVLECRRMLHLHTELCSRDYQYMRESIGISLSHTLTHIHMHACMHAFIHMHKYIGCVPHSCQVHCSDVEAIVLLWRATCTRVILSVFLDVFQDVGVNMTFTLARIILRSSACLGVPLFDSLLFEVSFT